MLLGDDRSPSGPAQPDEPLGVRTLGGGALRLRLTAGRPVAVLLLSGTLDSRCAPELPEVLLAAARACPDGLALDLRGVEECDAAGVAALGRACEHARMSGHPLGLAASTADLDRLMVFTDTLHLIAGHLDADSGPSC
ncbi:STAS domain-containing protein [Streptomyces sp. NRRL B-24484]|uniref:STAS domain-containing protein n=1 Tax=Streptomyces sp. NRRL B-24484 TaxID=1463833 RepID=UPI0004BE9D7C|nr:STAS domain-containing protein [Streptomyces sp. NRRL B-24484]